MVKPSANGLQKTLNKCETQNEIVFHIRLRHPKNDKQCFAKQCFANQTNRYPACFASRSELFRDSAHGKQNVVETFNSDTYVDKEKHRHRCLFRTCSDENKFLESNTV